MSKEKLFELASKFKDIKNEISRLNKQNKAIRELILEGMKEINKKSIQNSDHLIKYTQPKSFDEGMIAVYHKDLWKQYTKEEKKTIIDTIFLKKEFQKEQPDLYEKYLVDLTPRLTVK